MCVAVVMLKFNAPLGRTTTLTLQLNSHSCCVFCSYISTMLDGTDLHSSCWQLLLNQLHQITYWLEVLTSMHAQQLVLSIVCITPGRLVQDSDRGSSTMVRVTANIVACGTGAPPDDEMLAPPPDDIMMGLDEGTPAAPPSEAAANPSPDRSDGLQALADLGPLSTPGSIR